MIVDSRKVKDDNLLTQTHSARDCFEILNNLNIFTPLDVIFMQHLMKNTGCIDLYEKCLVYAEAQGALCFYEKQPGDNSTYFVLYKGKKSMKTNVAVYHVFLIKILID